VEEGMMMKGNVGSHQNDISFAKPTDSKRIKAVQVYQAKYSTQATTSTTKTVSSLFSSVFPFTSSRKSKKKSKKSFSIRFYNIFFILLYILQGGWVISTIGKPYKEFLLKAEREGFAVMVGMTRYRAEFEHVYQDINNPDRRTKKIGYFDWMNMDIEQLAEEKKKDKQRSVLDSLPKSMRVPNKYQTSFWATLLLGVTVTLHALVLLMQHWSVSFNIAINYREIDATAALNSIPDDFFQLSQDETSTLDNVVSPIEASVANGETKKFPTNERGERVIFDDREIVSVPSILPTHARIIPTKGSDVLVPIQYFPVLGMTFEYNRRRYYYSVETQTWNKIRCRTNFPITFLCNWSGFPAKEELISGQIRFGPNMFQVRRPTFMELYKKQLLNPFSVFQIFCVLLWAIDDYLIYSFFSLFMVLLFEGTVVFQRIKSLEALTNMGNPSRNVYAYRANQWILVDSAELLPGDIMSLVRIAPHRVKVEEGNTQGGSPPQKTGAIEDDGGDVVPADLLLLRGSTVVNEASLTGESVPQMKEGLSELVAGENLSIKMKHKTNVVYAGTKMLQCKGSMDDISYSPEDQRLVSESSASGPYSNIPPPPDHGCVCFVLRTGFASAQGKLVRMIEGSQERVKGHERETGLLLLLLCVFAVFSSGYVLYHGIQNENRSKYELLLHCILIVTSVIRPELPMQMAMAVNNSLMTLMKLHIFCTEPYRVPIAGKLNSCLFDKTGTLTTDELVAVGVCEPNKLNLPKDKLEDDDVKFLTPMSKISKGTAAALVIAGCHSLVVYDEETTGDPLESAALRSMRWHISLSSGNAEPAPAIGKIPAGQAITLNGDTFTSVNIVTRHHFSSKLQRMSCVIQVGGKKFAVAKGSPEAIGNLLTEKPLGYDEKSDYLSKQGYRVIGLGYKALSPTDSQLAIESRASCESNLAFAGFIAFTCMVRKDTASVLKRLKEGGMNVVMVTGDALLTAIHVAKEVRICEPIRDEPESDDDAILNDELRALLESKRGKRSQPQNPKLLHREYKPIAFLDVSEENALFWRDYDDGSTVEHFVAENIQRLSLKYELALTGTSLDHAFQHDPETRKYLQYIKVFARMSPVAKEFVIESLHSVGLLCMMCGDGANDVGALKQSDVGVALLTGFSNINVEKPEDEEHKEKKPDPAAGVTAIMSQRHLNEVRALPVALIKLKIRQLGGDPSKYPEIVEKEDLIKLYQITARHAAVKRHEEKNALEKKKKSKEEQALEKNAEKEEIQRRFLERTQELEAQGVSFASVKAIRDVLAEVSKKKKKEAVKVSGVTGSAAALAAQMDELGNAGLPMIKLGDASIAAPFTSKMPSIRNCVDIVRQGRCTLVSSMQMVRCIRRTFLSVLASLT
jgi:manganese-transporting P-type ATPase